MGLTRCYKTAAVFHIYETLLVRYPCHLSDRWGKKCPVGEESTDKLHMRVNVMYVTSTNAITVFWLSQSHQTHQLLV